ncbi:hypothetical protein [Streptococcus thoraltensis]
MTNTDWKPFNFKEFIKDSCYFAEAMTVDVNQKVLPKMLDKKISNWDNLIYMVKNFLLKTSTAAAVSKF